MSERNLFLSHQVETNPKVKKPEYSETVKQVLDSDVLTSESNKQTFTDSNGIRPDDGGDCREE